MIDCPSMEQRLAAVDARLRALLHPEAVHPVTPAPFITLSRETGSGAATIGHLVAERLTKAVEGDGTPWLLLDKELLGRALEHQHLPGRLAAFLPEDKVGEIRATIGELVGLHPSLWDLNAKVAEAILRFAHMGKVLLAGRGATWITRELEGGLHVRLVGSLEVRAGRIAEALKLGRSAAEAHCLKLDLARRRFVRSHFDRDVDDPHNYDLVLNTDALSLSDAADLIIAALARRLPPA